MKKKIIWAVLATALVVIIVVACKRSFEQFDGKATNAGASAACDPATCEPSECEIERSGTGTLPNVITTNMTLSNTQTWIMNGKVYVDDGAVLTIPAGTIINATPGTGAALVVTRGGKLNVEGTVDCPVVFTSGAKTPMPGDWGGIVLLGKAKVNKVNPVIEGINPGTVPAGIDIRYGGSDDNDNSGILAYVRIEYAGVAIAPDNELNGLTCGGVGRETIIDFVQVYKGNDDAFQFFGGTVNAYHLYAYVPDDDAFDFELGYRGTIQFAASVLNEIDDFSSNPNGIECGNDGICNSSDTPWTRPIISNMTILGVCDSTKSKKPGDVLLNGAHFRRGAKYVLRNSVIMGFPTGILLDTCVTHTLTLSAEIKYNVIQAFDRVAWKTFAPAGLVTLDASNKVFRYGGLAPKKANDSVKLVSPCNWSCPDFRPTTGSYAASGANFLGWTVATDGDYMYDPTITYRGAFAPCNEAGANWLAGWTRH